jgi:hypothetical protein
MNILYIPPHSQTQTCERRSITFKIVSSIPDSQSDVLLNADHPMINPPHSWISPGPSAQSKNEWNHQGGEDRCDRAPGLLLWGLYSIALWAVNASLSLLRTSDRNSKLEFQRSEGEMSDFLCDGASACVSRAVVCVLCQCSQNQYDHSNVQKAVRG